MKEKKKYIYSDLEKVDSITDNSIDYSDSPETDEAFWADAEIIYPKKKSTITIRIDDDTLSWFKAYGKGYQTKINAILKSYVSAHSSVKSE